MKYTIVLLLCCIWSALFSMDSQIPRKPSKGNLFPECVATLQRMKKNNKKEQLIVDVSSSRGFEIISTKDKKKLIEKEEKNVRGKNKSPKIAKLKPTLLRTNKFAILEEEN